MTLKNPSIRVDANQGASLFWGALSAIFFTLSGILLFELRTSDYENSSLREQVVMIHAQMLEVASSKARLESDLQEREQTVKAREDTVAAEEKRLADVESDPTAPHPATPTASNPDPKGPAPAANQSGTLDPNQLTLLKKFVLLGHQLVKESNASLGSQAGRPLVRIPNAKLFSMGDSSISMGGKALLSRVMGVLAAGQLDHSEMRIMLFTDRSGESDKGKNDPLSLTASRAVSVQRYLHEQTDLPLNHILCLGMGDQNPISSHEASNRRTEIILLPTPPSLPKDILSSLNAGNSDSKIGTGSTVTPSTNSLEPPPDAPTTSQP